MAKTSAMAKALGRLGGRARAKSLNAKRRKEIASKGGVARALSHHAVRRIMTNFYGWDAVKVLRRPPTVKSVSTTKEKLPGIYV